MNYYLDLTLVNQKKIIKSEIYNFYQFILLETTK